MTIGLTSFALHVLAMFFMACDHLWGTFILNADIFGYIGRLTFPIFAFLIVEGFFHTSSRKKYGQRLLIFALISEIPFNLMMGHTELYPIHQNVMWTFLLAIFMMVIFEKIKGLKHVVLRLPLYGLVVVLFFLLGIITFVDYYGYGLLMVALFYFTHPAAGSLRPAGFVYDPSVEEPIHKKILRMSVQAVLMYYINCEMMAGMVITLNIFAMDLEVYKQGFALLSLPLIWLYNGKQGPYNKTIRNIYYWFYPVHILILGVIVSYL